LKKTFKLHNPEYYIGVRDNFRNIKNYGDERRIYEGAGRNSL